MTIKLIKEIVDKCINKKKLKILNFEIIKKIMLSKIKDFDIKHSIFKAYNENIIDGANSVNDYNISVNIIHALIKKKYISNDVKINLLVLMEESENIIYEESFTNKKIINIIHRNIDNIKTYLIDNREEYILSGFINKMYVSDFIFDDLINFEEKIRNNNLDRTFITIVNKIRKKINKCYVPQYNIKKEDIFQIYAHHKIITNVNDGIRNLIKMYDISKKNQRLKKCREIIKQRFNEDIYDNIKNICINIHDNSEIIFNVNLCNNVKDTLETINEYINIKTINECSICYETKEVYKFHCLNVCLRCINQTKKNKIGVLNDYAKCLLCNSQIDLSYNFN